MRPLQLVGRWGFHILPLATRPSPCPKCTSQCSLSYSRRKLQSTISSKTLPKDPNGADQPVKRRRGRPRKNESLQSNVADTASPASSLPTEPIVEHIRPPELDRSGQSAPFNDQSSQESASGIEPSADQRASTPIPLESLPSPPAQRAKESAKLAALHARLSLPDRVPLTTLARTLVDRTADPDPRFNNDALSTLGNDILANHMAERLLVHHPRLPMPVLYAAQWAFVGPQALSSVAQEWGVECAAEPGGEVDPGLLQFKRAAPGENIDDYDKSTRPQDRNRRGDIVDWRRGQSSRVVYDDQYGDVQPHHSLESPATASLNRASATFVRALFGATYLHAGASRTYEMFRAHVLSRRLDLASLFTFSHPTRDLSRLCAREGFQSPVARLESESGRLSRSPVFVVGVYSGRDKLGEGAGASLDEARFKAAAAALKGWYLYSPVNAAGQPGFPGGELMVPSAMEREENRGKRWNQPIIDFGEVVA